MAILSIETKQPITRQPHPDVWRLIVDRLPQETLDNIIAAIDAKIGEEDEVKVAGWMPGNDWTNTPFQRIYEIAARYDFDLSARMFGLVAWEAFKRRTDQWFTTTTTFAGRDVENRVYFRPRS
jgi:hypothetical protein